MWWTKDNIRPIQSFKYRVPLDRNLEIWFSAENRRMPFFTQKVAMWCREHNIDWYLKKEPIDSGGLKEAGSNIKWFIQRDNIKDEAEICRLTTAMLDRYNVVATFRHEEDAILFKMRWS